MVFRFKSQYGLVALLCLGFSLNVLAASGLDARLDRTKIAEGETTVLTLSAPGGVNGAPDLSPLAKDFEVLNQSQSSRMSIVNGHTDSTREWQLVLTPKHYGKLGIPPLHLGNMSSAPLSLEVLPAAQAAKLGKSQPVMLETEVGPDKPFVQQEVIYTVRILTRVALSQASLSDPHAGNAVVESLGKDKNYTTYRGGREYQVIERRYAIFPQHSGKLEIDPPVLSAQVPDSKRRSGNSLRDRFFGSDPFAGLGGFFDQTRPVRMRARNITLDVKARPAAAPSPWLPAQSLTLAETWSPEPPVFRVGEPVTRTIAITAQGVTAAQLPEPAPPAPDGVKVYPNQPQSESRPDGDTLVTQKILKSALVPSRAGELNLPEIRIPWWDTTANKPRQAVLPARTVKVLPALAGASTAPPAVTAPQAAAASSPPASSRSVASQPPSEVSANTALNIGSVAVSSSHPASGIWPWASAFFALAWLVTIELWRRARVGQSSIPKSGSAPVPIAHDPAKYLGKLRQACKENSPKAARQALLDWGAAHWPNNPPRRLETLAGRLDAADAATVFNDLDRGLYAGIEHAWDGAAAWKVLSPLLNAGGSSKAASSHRRAELPPLYSRQA